MKPLLHRRKTTRAAERSGRRGMTLVEVLWACGILAMLAVAAGSFVTVSGGVVSVSRNHRIALEAANSRLEDIRASGFNSVKPETQDFTIRYLSRVGSSWQITSSNPNETLWIQGRNYPIITTLQYVDSSGGFTSCDVLRISVSVLYRQNEPNEVKIWAYMGP